MYRIAIIDDSEQDAALTQQHLSQWEQMRGEPIQTERFSSAERFLFRYAEDKDWDILLLDIEMTGMDGVELAKKIRRDNETVQLVFITGFPDFIAEGYEVGALHYLMKPVRQEKIMQVLDRAVSAICKADRCIVLNVGAEVLRLSVSHIVYAEAFSHTCVIATQHDTIPIKLPISEVEKLLGSGFIRCHRSYLVGLRYIARLSKTEVILDNGKTIPMSRNAASAVHKAFISYYAGEKDETI